MSDLDEHGRTVAERIMDALHASSGYCGHCAKKKCAGRRQHSVLPETLNTDDVLAAIKKAIGEEALTALAPTPDVTKGEP